jgi:penicillin-binding protein 1A
VNAPYIAEMARVAMLQRFGPAALTDGYAVTTTVDSRLQRAADEAAWRAILEYDRRHGYRGPAERLVAGTDEDPRALTAAFLRHPPRGNLSPAVVSAVGERSATARLRNGAQVELPWEGLSWARPALGKGEALGPSPKSASDIVAVGDFIYLELQPDGRAQLAQLPIVSGAIVALQPRDGSIVALVGGFDFNESKYNRVTQAQRQPGSAFKPFLYSAALEHGFTPATLVNDAPIVMAGGGGADGDEEWRPQNITRKFYGPTPVREGLVRSRNLVSIRLLRGTGLLPATRHIQNFGFKPSALPPNLTLALGTGQTTPLEMARGFAVFANGGYRVTPFFIDSIEDARGTEVFRSQPLLACPECALADAAAAVATPVATAAAQPALELSPAAITTPVATAAAQPALVASPVATLPPGEDASAPGAVVPAAQRAPQAISPANAFVMTDMMTDVIRRGTAQRALVLGRKDIAGKTGTTSDRRDTWFVGFNADLAAAVWIGFDQERSLGENEEGGRTALPMWIYFMQEALRDRPEHRLPEPPGVVRMWVSRESGTPTRAGAPGALFEVFLEQYAPQTGLIDYSDEVGAETVEPATGDDSLF